MAEGATFLGLGLTVPADLENTLGYEVNGTNTTHDDLLAAIAAVIAVPYPAVTLDILDTPGGNVLLTALVEYLCIEIL